MDFAQHLSKSPSISTTTHSARVMIAISSLCRIDSSVMLADETMAHNPSAHIALM
jgi:hypothetical protein